MKKLNTKDQFVRRAKIQGLKSLKLGAKLRKIRVQLNKIKNQGPSCERHSH
jgi:hypothetical protein